MKASEIVAMRLVTRLSRSVFCTCANLSEKMTSLMKKHVINLVKVMSVQDKKPVCMSDAVSRASGVFNIME